MLSQTVEYALRAMVCLAQSPDQLTPTPALASKTKVPPNYLAKVLQVLAQAELIEGRRGVGGGYKLSRPAGDISMLDVVNAIDTLKPITSCPLEISEHGSSLCSLHRRIDQAIRLLIEQFEGVTLHDLITEANPSAPLCETNPKVQIRVSGG
jgi:Rrf2 family protein